MSKSLVAYFSASGVTAKAAENACKGSRCRSLEIKPEKPYSDADLDWTDKKSRSSIEMTDPSSRPAITGKISNMADYNVVYGRFPDLVVCGSHDYHTFLESYDLTGKTIIPFATSGGSGMAKPTKCLRQAAPAQHC